LSPAEAAKYLGTTAGSLAVWRSTGARQIPYVKVGTSVRYLQNDLDKWIAQHRVKG
jgi:excisionase family DNA binding protein